MWSPQNILGLLCLIAAAIVPWVFPDEAGRGMGSSLTVLGGMLLGWAPPAPVPGVKPPPAAPPASRGMARIDGLVIAAAVGATVAVFVALLGAGGCASTDIRAETEVHPFFDPGPPCLITVDVDGHRVHRTRWDQPCPIDMPTAWLCARLAEKAPGAQLPAVCTP